MKRFLPLLALVALTGCSRSSSSQNPPEPKPGISATRADVDAVRNEIARVHPNGAPTTIESTSVVFDILEKAKTKNEVLGVRGWALENMMMLPGVAQMANMPPEHLTIASNIEKWIIAACDAKLDTGIASNSDAKYLNAKENALAETKRGDELLKVQSITPIP